VDAPVAPDINRVVHRTRAFLLAQTMTKEKNPPKRGDDSTGRKT
jgi:hypothetical protein